MKTEKKVNLVRLNKLIADSGLTSRRKADELIENGEVQVNGRCVYELGIKVDPKHDKVAVKGRLLRQQTDKIYLMFHKPAQVLSTLTDPEGRTTVADFFKKLPFRVFPIGRLDWSSEGLLLMTNDGDFCNKVIHPKFEVTKTYHVKVSGEPGQEQLNKLLNGVTIPTGKVAAKSVSRMTNKDTKYDWLRIVITEGHNRQIRYMLEKIGCDVIKLQRVAIGQLKLGSLKKGKFKLLNEKDLEKIFRKFED